MSMIFNSSKSAALRTFCALTCILCTELRSTAQSRIAASPRSPVFAVYLDGCAIVVLDAAATVLARISYDARVAALQISPLGELVACLSREGDLLLWNWPLGTAVQARPFDGSAYSGDDYREVDELRFSPNGKQLLVGVRGHQVRVVSSSGELEGAIDGVRNLGDCASIVWDGSGSRLAFANDVGVAILDGQTFAPVVSPGGETLGLNFHSRVECLEFNPTSPQLATGHSDGFIRITETRTGGLVQSFKHVDPFYGVLTVERGNDCTWEHSWIGWIAHSRDGTRLAYTSASGVYLGCFDLVNGERVALGPYSDGRMGVPAEIQWGPCDKRAYYGIIGGQSRLLWGDFRGRAQFGASDTSVRTVPRFGDEDVGVFLDGIALRAINGVTGDLLWSRTDAELRSARVVKLEDAMPPK